METAPENQENDTYAEEVYEEGVQTENDEKMQEEPKQDNQEDEAKGNFIHGLSVGFGIGCIATFVIVWIAVFFTPQLPPSITYENLLSIFVYPLIYLLAIGLVALTAGVTRQFYSRRHK